MLILNQSFQQTKSWKKRRKKVNLEETEARTLFAIIWKGKLKKNFKKHISETSVNYRLKRWRYIVRIKSNNFHDHKLNLQC